MALFGSWTIASNLFSSSKGPNQSGTIVCSLTAFTHAHKKKKQKNTKHLQSVALKLLRAGGPHFCLPEDSGGMSVCYTCYLISPLCGKGARFSLLLFFVLHYPFANGLHRCSFSFIPLGFREWIMLFAEPLDLGSLQGRGGFIIWKLPVLGSQMLCSPALCNQMHFIWNQSPGSGRRTLGEGVALCFFNSFDFPSKHYLTDDASCK